MKSVKARKSTSIADYFIKKTDSNKNIPKEDSKVIAEAIVDLTIEVLELLSKFVNSIYRGGYL